MTTADLTHSPLHDRHQALGAKFAPFGGWSMPIEYAGGGVITEHTAVREGVGIFDVSHLGKVSVIGSGAAEFVNCCFTNDIDRIGAGQAQYTLCCAGDGGVVDDIIVYRHSDDHVFAIPNAANNASVVALLSDAAPAGIEVENLHRDYAVIAVQGPRSAQVLAAIGLPSEHPYMSFAATHYDGTQLTVCRTGYTGEHGYELVVPASGAGEVWDALFATSEVRAAGLGARDTLRTEMGYPLHGQDISPAITPVQARLGWAVGWKKPEFWGKAALEAEKAAGPRRLAWGLRGTGRGIARAGMPVFLPGSDDTVGVTTSGTFSPTLRNAIALALLNAGDDVVDGAAVEVEVRGRRVPMEITRPPFLETNPR